jgi:Predicted GTPases
LIKVPAPETAALPLVETAHATEALRERLVNVLDSSGNPALAELTSSTPLGTAGDAICLVFVGQYNSGKSSLITCLTGLDIPIGADVTTSRAATYPWRGHLLVDTPGVRARQDVAHDAATDRALDLADAVVFVLTGDGFDETTADYFLELLARLRAHGQLIVVVNKAHSEDSDRAEILADMRRVYEGVGETVPLVWTEARDWLTATAYPDPYARRRRSDVPSLARTIDEMVRQRGAQLRLATPLRELSRHVGAAIDVAVSSGVKKAIDTIDQLSDEIEQRRNDLLNAVRVAAERARSELAAKLTALGADHDPSDVDGVLAAVQASFVDTLNDNADHVIEEGSKALAILDRSLVATPNAVMIPEDRWTQVRAQLLNGLKVVARTFQGEGARPGGAGHRIVMKAWHAVGGKFKPWGAVRAAENVGKAAQVGGVVLIVGEGAVGLWADYRAQQQAARAADAMRAWTQTVRQIAEETTRDWIATADLAVHAMCDEDQQLVGRRKVLLLAEVADADDTVRQLVALDDEILGLLQQLS